MPAIRATSSRRSPCGDSFRVELMGCRAEHNKPILNSVLDSLGHTDLHFCPEIADLAIARDRCGNMTEPMGRSRTRRLI